MTVLFVYSEKKEPPPDLMESGTGNGVSLLDNKMCLYNPSFHLIFNSMNAVKYAQICFMIVI